MGTSALIVVPCWEFDKSVCDSIYLVIKTKIITLDLAELNAFYNLKEIYDLWNRIV